MVSSFLFYMVDRKPSLFHSFPLSPLPLRLYLHMCYILPFLLFYSSLLCLFSSMLPYSFCTTYCTTAPSPGTPVPNFPLFSSSYNYTPYTLQMSLLLWVLSTSPYTLPLLLEAAPLPCYVPSPFPTPSTVVPLPLVFSSSYSDTPTSCVPSLHIQNTSLLLLLFPTSSPLSPCTALLNFPRFQIYLLLPSPFSALLHFYTFR